MKTIFYVLILIIFSFPIKAQNVYDLENILELAYENSWSSKNANLKSAWVKESYKLYRAKLKPQVGISGLIPAFYRTTNGVTQSNGSIIFNQVAQNNSSLSAYALQEIPITGGQIFIQSDLTRFDDFSNEYQAYNGVPIRFGIIQPLFSRKELKWASKIEPLKLQEAEREFKMEIELTHLEALDHYFSIVISTENQKIAQTNSLIIEQLLEIAAERLVLGKISEDEKIQLEISLANANIDMETAMFDVQTAKKNLSSFLGYDNFGEQDEFRTSVPGQSYELSVELALRQTKLNRPEEISHARQLLEARQALSNAKIDNGPQANLVASLGYARGSEKLKDVYSQPFVEQQLSLSFQVPILDWGNRKTAIHQNQIQLEMTKSRIKQESINLENLVVVKVKEFLLQQRAVQNQENIKVLAEKRYSIARESYVLGAKNVTDLGLAQQDKDQSNRAYVLAIYRYWKTYYELRLLTGYDFINNTKITY